jgi:hypothetical protein
MVAHKVVVIIFDSIFDYVSAKVFLRFFYVLGKFVGG